MDNIIAFSAAIEELQRNIHRLKGKAMRTFGLGISDLNCLITLKRNPDGLTSTELSRHCRLDKALISRTVRKLIEKGAIAYEQPRFVEVEDPKSEGGVIRRGAYRIRLRLTKLGEEMTQELYHVAADAATFAIHSIDPGEVALFLSTLEKVGANFQEYVDQHGVNIDDEESL